MSRLETLRGHYLLTGGFLLSRTLEGTERVMPAKSWGGGDCITVFVMENVIGIMYGVVILM